MTSKEVQKELIDLYRSKGVSTKITVVPDGCWIYQSEGEKVFVEAEGYTNEKDWVINNYLRMVDNRLNIKH